VLQQRHFTEDDVVCFARQLVLDGAVLGAAQQELVHQRIQLSLPAPPLQSVNQLINQSSNQSLNQAIKPASQQASKQQASSKQAASKQQASSKQASINSDVQHVQKLHSQAKVVKQEGMDVDLPHRGKYINQRGSTGAVTQGLRATE